MKRKKLKLKKQYQIIFFVFILIVGFFSLIKYIDTYTENNFYLRTETKEEVYRKKFEELGYNDEEIKLFLQQDTKTIKYMMNSDKNEDFYYFISQKYFLSKNLISYINFKQTNKDKDYKNIIAIINTKTDKEYYSENIATDISKDNLMLVNKYYSLDKDFTPKLVPISNLYTYSENYATEETYNAYINMYKAAKKDNIDLLITSSYRSYTEQDMVYENYKNYYGVDKVDEIAARPGYSEHQTGLALDIFTPGSTMDNFHNTTAYNWLINNCYKFGFILRYPNDKELLTGFKSESWHYRYVGIEVATQIYNEDITYDEYYAYYLAK